MIQCSCAHVRVTLIPLTCRAQTTPLLWVKRGMVPNMYRPGLASEYLRRNRPTLNVLVSTVPRSSYTVYGPPGWFLRALRTTISDLFHVGNALCGKIQYELTIGGRNYH